MQTQAELIAEIISDLMKALRPFAHAYEVHGIDRPCLTEADLRGMYRAVDVQDYRRASQVLDKATRTV